MLKCSPYMQAITATLAIVHPRQISYLPDHPALVFFFVVFLDVLFFQELGDKRHHDFLPPTLEDLAQGLMLLTTEASGGRIEAYERKSFIGENEHQSRVIR